MADPVSSETLVGTLIGALFGFLSSFAVFRSRFTRLEERQEAMKDQFKIELAHLRDDARTEWGRIREDVNRVCRGDDDARRRQERREIHTLELLGDIAKALRVANRYTDWGNDEPKDDRHTGT